MWACKTFPPITFLKSKKAYNYPIYTDSKIAMSWVKKKQCRTIKKEKKRLLKEIDFLKTYISQNENQRKSKNVGAELNLVSREVQELK